MKVKIVYNTQEAMHVLYGMCFHKKCIQNTRDHFTCKYFSRDSLYFFNQPDASWVTSLWPKQRFILLFDPKSFILSKDVYIPQINTKFEINQTNRYPKLYISVHHEHARFQVVVVSLHGFFCVYKMKKIHIFKSQCGAFLT